MERIYQTKEVAQLLGMARETVYRKVKSGEIPAIRVGGDLRFPSSLLEKWIEEKKSETPDRWRTRLRQFVDLIKETWGNDLVSVILFGSFASGKETSKSDIDLLIVNNSFPKSRLRRQGLIFDMAKSISPAFAHKLSPLPLTPQETNQPKSLYLGVLDSYEILLDKNSFFGNILKKFKDEFEKAGVEQKLDETNSPYWVFPRKRELQ